MPAAPNIEDIVGHLIDAMQAWRGQAVGYIAAFASPLPPCPNAELLAGWR